MLKTLFASILLIGQIKGDWNYNDPSLWLKDFEFCGAAGESPIDIKTSSVKKDKNVCSEEFSWNLLPPKYGTYKVVNSGHTIAVTPVSNVSHHAPPRGTSSGGGLQHRRRRLAGSGAVSKDGYTSLTGRDNTIGVLKNQFKTVPGTHEYFCLHSFHFHWGGDKYHERGSEHLVDKFAYPLEVHFVHYSCDFDNLTEALAYSLSDNPKDKYVLGVIGVFFEINQTPNPAIDKILSDEVVRRGKFPAGFGSYSGSTVVDELNVEHLIPKNKSLWAYDGSLTTPPCYPIVRWHVMQNTVPISIKQLDRFKVFFGDVNTSLSDNFRPVQPNPHPVYHCDPHRHDPNTGHGSGHGSGHGDGHDGPYKGLAANGLAVFLIVAGVIFACFGVISIPFCKDNWKGKCCNGNGHGHGHTAHANLKVGSFSHLTSKREHV